MTSVTVFPEIFNERYLPHLGSTARTQIFYGGSSSGKSVFMTQRVVYDVMSGGRNYLICRQVGRTIRGSVFTQVLRTIADWQVQHLFSVNKSDMLITCRNGYQIIFVGLDDVQKLKSLTPAKGALTDIWIEEATETARETVKELYKRQRGGDESTSKRVVLTFNPIMQNHWIYEEFFEPHGWSDQRDYLEADGLLILKSWYEHNKFLTPADVSDLLSETDDYYRNVYTLGNWGILGDVIFTNWETADLSGMKKQFTNPRHGLDFGFSSDPAALIVTHYDRKNKTIYVYNELYERGMTNDVLSRHCRPLVGDDLITADSAEPKSIEECRQHGLVIVGAVKGKDSVLYGIQWLQQQRIIVDERCVNTINELRAYHWRKDKDGNSIRQPVGKNNHLIDALRYAYESDNEADWSDVVELGKVEEFVSPWA